jgi:hypothetical protein
VILTAANLLVPSVPQSIYAIVPGHDDRVEARIVAIDELADIAILEAPEMSVTPVALQWSAQLGDNVWVVSFPWGRRGTVVSGVVSQIETSAAETRLPVSGPVGLIDAAVSYGTSGGGVFDARTGHLVGLVRGYRTAKLSLPGTPTQSLDDRDLCNGDPLPGCPLGNRRRPQGGVGSTDRRHARSCLRGRLSGEAGVPLRSARLRWQPTGPE